LTINKSSVWHPQNASKTAPFAPFSANPDEQKKNVNISAAESGGIMLTFPRQNRKKMVRTPLVIVRRRLPFLSGRQPPHEAPGTQKGLPQGRPENMTILKLEITENAQCTAFASS
jgi:hypothetical protein